MASAGVYGASGRSHRAVSISTRVTTGLAP
jgi:hypothetical protein